MPPTSHRRRAVRAWWRGLVLLLAGALGIVSSDVGAHALLGAGAFSSGLEAASPLDAGSPAPAPAPAHDERQCPVCLVHAPAVAASDQIPPGRLAGSSASTTPDRVVVPIARSRRPDAARAPPHVLFS
jgi:hypothetical protein